MKANIIFFSGTINPNTGEILMARLEPSLDLFRSEPVKDMRFNPSVRHDAPNNDPTLTCFHELKGRKHEKSR